MIPVLLAPRLASSNDPQSLPLLPAEEGDSASGFGAALEAEAEGPPDDDLWPGWVQPTDGTEPRQIRLAGLPGEITAEGAAQAVTADLSLQITGMLLSPGHAMAAACDAVAMADIAAIAPVVALPQEAHDLPAGMPEPVGVTVVSPPDELTEPLPATPLVSAAVPTPAPETAMMPDRAVAADRPTGLQASPLPRPDRPAPVPQGYDLAAPEQAALPEDLSRVLLARPLQSGAVEGAIRFVLAASETQDAQPLLPPPTATAAEVNPTDPRRRHVGQALPPEDEAFFSEDASARAARLAPDSAAAPRLAVPAPVPPDPTILPASDEGVPQDLAAIGDAEALHALSDTPRSHARTLSMQVSPASLPASLPSAILGVVLAPVPGGVEVALSPAELGQLRIEVTPDGDTLRILLSAERPETLELLRRNSDQLMVEVLQAGFSGAAMSFGTWGGQSGGEGGSSNPPALLADSDARPDVDAAFAHLPHLPAHAGGLNLRL